eukprot:GHVU01100965.1.p1 GENE.GHVU01100965.1~~GHVU01100965.1.p1  ORF type:complete len:595 (+),score=62.21 GHVU01100965.1:302-2086(+)
MDKGNKIRKCMKQLIDGKFKGPDDRSPKRLLELMTEYMQAGTTPVVDDGAVLSQICMVIRDLTDAKEVSSMVPKLEKEFLSSGRLKVLKEFMHRICKVPWSRDEDRDFRAMLLYTMLSCYYLLLMLTRYNQTQIWTQLVQEGFPGVIAEDLTSNQWFWKRRNFKEYGADKIDEMGPMIGLSLLKNFVDENAFPGEMVQYVTQMLDHYIDERENDIELIILAISLNYKLNSTNTIHKLLFTTTVFKKIAEFLNLTSVHSESSLVQTRAKTTPDFSTAWVINLKSLLNCLLSLTYSDDYKCHTILAFVKCDKKLDEIIKNGHSVEKELLKNLFQLLCRHSCSKCSWSYIGDLLLKHGIVLAPTDPKSLKAHLPDQGAAVMERGRFQCPYMNICHIFLRMLDIDDGGASLLDQYLDPDFHRCFCTDCMNARQDKLTYDRGTPPKTHALPVGWAKFALKVPPRAVPWQMFQDWHMAFHGTTTDKLQSILQTGQLRMKGDIEHGSRGRDVEVFHVSPSILYAKLDSVPANFRYDKSSTSMGRVALQVRIGPNSYKVQQERHKSDKKIDPHFHNTELEWATTRQDDVIIVGILIRVNESH